MKVDILKKVNRIIFKWAIMYNCMSNIPKHLAGRGKEDQEFKASLCYTIWVTYDHLKNKGISEKQNTRFVQVGLKHNRRINV